MRSEFKDHNSFLSCSDLSWLEQVFCEQVYPKLDHFNDYEDPPFLLNGLLDGYYCEVDPIVVSDTEWELVVFYGEYCFKDIKEQYKFFVNVIKEKQSYKASLKKTYLRDIEISNKSLPDSLNYIFKQPSYN